MNVETAFGLVLRDIRTENQVSQEKLAQLCDLDRTFISLLERGHRQPSITTVFKLAEALQSSASEILRRVEQKLLESHQD